MLKHVASFFISPCYFCFCHPLVTHLPLSTTKQSRGPRNAALNSHQLLAFLEAKLPFSRHSGFAVPADSIHPMLKPRQRDIVRWALHGGRRAIFAAFGLGKSFMQLECIRQLFIF
ncbi:hypothetical protein HNQ38_000588 [Desulfovibrio intestinalis]|uniref:Uncharacterized protein n=1 Tax=Desulfovibrio intestinalis TaxID=58621 RepID=A0A7W8C180_9BACT|nr:hypothetical protein [Desulfovibrio intestinalis]